MLAGVNQFVSNLEAHRIELGMTHRAFAKYMGMSVSTWTQRRNDKWPAGPAFIGRVITARPEFYRFLLSAKEVSTDEHAA
jgi:DNA-binding transcriptional regulator YiaG